MNGMIALPKVLFIENKWCAGKPQWGISEWESNLLLSLKETGLAQTDAFYFDEYFSIHQKRGDNALLQKIREWKPDMLVVIFSGIPGSAVNVPDWETFRSIRDDLKIPITAIWGDCRCPEQTDLIKIVAPFTTLNLITDAGSAVKRLKKSVPNPEKYFHVWVPKRPSIFNDPGKNRDIDALYLGSSRATRHAKLRALLNNGISLITGGSESIEHLSTEQYADKYQRAKIAVNFSRGGFGCLITARFYEATACGAMLLEEDGFETPVRFIPYVDYIPYHGTKDLVRKARYYLEHDDEREKIAKSGREKTLSQYSAEQFWKFAINRTLFKEKTTELPDSAVRWSNLSHMPKWRAVMTKSAYSFCSTETGFLAYDTVSRRANKLWFYGILKKFPIFFALYRRLRHGENLRSS